ncbi:MAG: ABC transporter permease subunit [Streptococcaceae bacterium]|jgi:NitT/TauT family transport system permease protein|nr:ABC transporter permease subunit [Streptococcaceae bacterium]
MSKKGYLRLFFPSIAAVITLILQLNLSNGIVEFKQIPSYYDKALMLIIPLTLLAAVSYLKWQKPAKYLHKAWFYGAVLLALSLYNILSQKLALINQQVFPTIDKMINVYVVDGQFLLQNDLSTVSMLIIGVLIGGVIGIATGTLMGWYTSWFYWLDPIVRAFGPTPVVILIPIIFNIFPTTYSSAIFVIVLAMWFPTIVMTNSGVQNLKKTYFEIADVLGASNFQKIIRVALPGALPNIFVGLFSGICSAFSAVVISEQMGVGQGLGYYINAQKQVMNYQNVYAALFLMAFTFSLVIAILFKFRSHFLRWQKGFIKW